MSGPAASPPRRVGLDDLRSHCQQLLELAGFPPDPAAVTADSLADAEARGISSHGVMRTRIYTERARAGALDARARPQVVSATSSSVYLDAANGPGHLAARAGIDAAADLAAEGAIGVAGVRDSNHCGTLAYFARRATARGLIALAATTAPATMAYFGGRTRAVGTNPLCIAVPRPDGPPIVADMATSATARGRIILAAQLGTPVPEGWAVDPAGRPTTDAAAAMAGTMLPFGGPKGSALAMMVDLLCGALLAGVTGAGIGPLYDNLDDPQRITHLFIVLNPAAWLGAEPFAAHVAAFADHVHQLPPADGFDEVLLPGEVEERARARAERDGVLLPGGVAADLDRLGEELGAASGLPGTPDPATAQAGAGP